MAAPYTHQDYAGPNYTGQQQPYGQVHEKQQPYEHHAAHQQPIYNQQQQGYWQSPPQPASQYPHHQQTYAAPPVQPHNATGRRCCGIKRSIFIILMVCAGIIIVAVAVGVGVGVGVAAKHSSSSSGSATTTSSAPSPTPTVNEVACPQANGTTYVTTASSGSKRFTRFCGLDYGGTGEATDIGNVITGSMSECMDKCAAAGNCTGAGWGQMDKDKDGRHTCWMKNALIKPHVATSNQWNFARMELAASG